MGPPSPAPIALVDGEDVLASAIQCDLAAVLDQRSVRVCGIGGILIQPGRTADHTWELVERLLDQAAREGASLALAFSGMSHEPTALRVRVRHSAAPGICCTSVVVAAPGGVAITSNESSGTPPPGTTSSQGRPSAGVGSGLSRSCDGLLGGVASEVAGPRLTQETGRQALPDERRQ